MISIIKKTIKKFLENRKSGRLINVLKTDLFLVSYPKSGNTWLRFLLGNVLYEDYNFSNMEDLIPDIYVVNNKELNKIKSPRILKSHEYFDPRYKKIIYIVRDPRSVSISYFEYLKKMKSISKNMKFDNFLDLFLNGELDNYGSWSENVNSWVATKKEDKNFLIIKYENLKKDTLGSLSKIVNFLDLE